uniref:Uncharacterized protein n=1 Tax=Globodera pallida TaxID=36090 RepID=A0A183C3D5_GLOPA
MNPKYDGHSSSHHQQEGRQQFDEISLNVSPAHPMSYVLSPLGEATLSLSAEESVTSGTSPTAIVPPTTPEQIDQLQLSEPADPPKDLPVRAVVAPGGSSPHTQPMPPQHSPPPIYATIYPPGTNPATSLGHIPLYANCSPTYIINAGVNRTGKRAELSPTLLVHGTIFEPTHLDTPPVLILTDPYCELAHRRRAQAVLSLMFLFFPMFALLLILMSIRGLNSHWLF